MVDGDCNLCESRRARPMFVVERFSRPFRVVRCPDCGLAYVYPCPNQAELADLYGESYFTGSAEYAYTDERQRMEAALVLHHARLQVMERYVSPGRLLDVGCAFGGLLCAARERGWEAHGIEPSPYARRWAVEKMGLDVRPQELEMVDFPPSHFDAVTMIELIEHLPHPLESLRAAHRLMRPEGLLVIQTSSIVSVKARLSGRRWDYLLPGHLHYFSPATLHQMLAKAGFGMVSFFSGDEMSLGAKIRYQALVQARLGIGQRLKVAAKHILRRAHLGDITLAGGMVLYARARESSE